MIPKSVIDFIVKRFDFEPTTLRRILEADQCTNSTVLAAKVEAESRLAAWKLLRPTCWQRFMMAIKSDKDRGFASGGYVKGPLSEEGIALLTEHLRFRPGEYEIPKEGVMTRCIPQSYVDAMNRNMTSTIMGGESADNDSTMTLRKLGDAIFEVERILNNSGIDSIAGATNLFAHENMMLDARKLADAIEALPFYQRPVVERSGLVPPGYIIAMNGSEVAGIIHA